MNKSEPTFEHEEAFIRAFVLREKRERLLSLVASGKSRREFSAESAHFRWFDPRYATPVKWIVDPALPLWDRYLEGIGNVARLLRSKGAGATCCVISEDSKLDGKTLTLESALESVAGSGMGTILSCVPGKLAYFEGEDESLVLAR